MAQRTTTPDDELQTSEARTPLAEPPGTIYFVTAHTTIANQGPLIYRVLFGPSRSRSAAIEALTHYFPPTGGIISDYSVMDWEGNNNHVRWKDVNGEVVAKIETEKNSVVCASGAEQALFSIVRRETDYNNTPVSETAEIAGTFLNKAEATVAALRMFREEIEGHRLEGVVEMVQDNGMLFCKAQSAGQGGHRWTVEVTGGTWQEALH